MKKKRGKSEDRTKLSTGKSFAKKEKKTKRIVPFYIPLSPNFVTETKRRGSRKLKLQKTWGWTSESKRFTRFAPLFLERERKKKKTKKGNEEQSPLSLFPSLSPLRFSAHDTRGKRAGGLSDIREYSIPVHDTSRRGNFFPR